MITRRKVLGYVALSVASAFGVTNLLAQPAKQRNEQGRVPETRDVEGIIERILPSGDIILCEGSSSVYRLRFEGQQSMKHGDEVLACVDMRDDLFGVGYSTRKDLQTVETPISITAMRAGRKVGLYRNNLFP